MSRPSAAADLKLLLDHMIAGRLRSHVGAEFDWQDLGEAWALNKKGGTAGKIVLTWT
jgi:NADPH:quinone reductase-like Zn-dependent oxidoreductase